MKNYFRWTVTMLALINFLLLVTFSLQTANADTATLTNDDCIKCHTEAPMDIEAQGGAHKTEVTCIDCHNGHPPNVQDIIPACSNCHTGKAHFELENCLSCHSNPHAPLALKLAKNITDPCLTCHQTEGEQLKNNKSFHSTMACTACHQQHGQIPECISCHEPHADDMVQADCKQCHQAHKPLLVTYQDDTPSKSCAACHEEAYEQLSSYIRTDDIAHTIDTEWSFAYVNNTAYEIYA